MNINMCMLEGVCILTYIHAYIWVYFPLCIYIYKYIHMYLTIWTIYMRTHEVTDVYIYIYIYAPWSW